MRTHGHHVFFPLLQTYQKKGIMTPWCNYVAVLSAVFTRTGP